MKFLYNIVLIILLLLLFTGLAQSAPKFEAKRLIRGESLHYNAKWGLLTIGSAYSQTDKQLYKVGSAVRYKINLGGSTNGLAKLFSLNDKWTSYVDIKTFSTYKSYRCIREGKYKLDEIVYFDYVNKRANVNNYNYSSKTFVPYKVYNTGNYVRDVVAGFMLIRLIDLSKYKKGDKINISGFYKSEGYSIDVFIGEKEYVKTAKNKVLCYKLKPIVPDKKKKDGLKDLEVWVSCDKKQIITKAVAHLYIGDLVLEIAS